MGRHTESFDSTESASLVAPQIESGEAPALTRRELRAREETGLSETVPLVPRLPSATDSDDSDDSDESDDGRDDDSDDGLVQEIERQLAEHSRSAAAYTPALVATERAATFVVPQKSDTVLASPVVSAARLRRRSRGSFLQLRAQKKAAGRQSLTPLPFSPPRTLSFPRPTPSWHPTSHRADHGQQGWEQSRLHRSQPILVRAARSTAPRPGRRARERSRASPPA